MKKKISTLNRSMSVYVYKKDRQVEGYKKINIERQYSN